MAFDANKPIKSSGDVLLSAVEEYSGPFGFRKVPPERQPYVDARMELGFYKKELVRNIIWANWISWDQTKPVEQDKAIAWLEAQRARLLKWHRSWSDKIDTNQLLREVFHTSGDRFDVAARDFAVKVLGF